MLRRYQSLFAALAITWASLVALPAPYAPACDLLAAVEKVIDGGEITPAAAVSAPKTISIHLKKSNSTKVTQNAKEVQVEPSQFFEFVRLRIKQDRNLKQLMHQDTAVFMERMRAEYREFVQITQVDFIHQKDGQEVLALKIITPEFLETFARQSKTKAEWDKKIDSFYDRDNTVWRGMATAKEDMPANPEAEVISMFKGLSLHFSSQRILQTLEYDATPGTIRRSALADIRRYNKALVNGTLKDWAEAHTQAKEGEVYDYYDTPFFSTSTRERVGKDFAMGAMAFGEYDGSYRSADVQSQIGMRVNVGMLRSFKDVRSGRLRQHFAEYRDLYPRQSEVMGVGACDADAVMIVKTYDGKGKVLQTFLRNPDAPQQVWIISGDFSYSGRNFKAPPPERIVKTVKL